MAKVESSSLPATATLISTLSIWPLAHLPSELNQPQPANRTEPRFGMTSGLATNHPEHLKRHPRDGHVPPKQGTGSTLPKCTFFKHYRVGYELEARSEERRVGKECR